MKQILKLTVLAAAPLLMAAWWMDDQPSFKAYEAPVLVLPETAVPVSGRESVTWQSDLRNPATPTEETLSHGRTLFEINCAMCHGRTSSERGPVGKKLVPPPPVLAPELVQSRGDAHIFKAVTLGFGRMPAFKDKLTPKERWFLVNYLRTRK